MTCSSATVCTECKTGFVKMDGTSPTPCISKCDTGFAYLSVDGKSCYDDCANSNYKYNNWINSNYLDLVDGSRTYLNAAGT